MLNKFDTSEKDMLQFSHNTLNHSMRMKLRNHQFAYRILFKESEEKIKEEKAKSSCVL